MENLKFKPLTLENWPAFEELMGERGGCGGCWCMYYRLPRNQWNSNKGTGNKKRQKKLVDSGKPTGLIAFHKKEPIGWMALAPREHYPRIEGARTLKRIDDKPVWSITCFFVKKEYRRQGVSKALVKGAIDYARKNKINTLEAYPAIRYSENLPANFFWTGLLSVFEDNGFEVVWSNRKSKAMVRLDV